MDISLPGTDGGVVAGEGVGGTAFCVLCSEERVGLYRAQIGDWDVARVLYFDSVEGLLGHCLLWPPHAVIVDMTTQIMIGSKHVTYLYGLRMSWPVMRCKDMPDGTFNVMCQRPMRNEKLMKTLGSIAGGDPTWVGLAGLRRHIRMSMVRRARFRVGDGEWERVNTTNISGAGLFLVTYHPPALGAVVSVEIYDLSEEPVVVEGVVIRVNTWETSDDLPGVAVQVGDHGACAYLARMIASHELTEVFREYG